MLFYLPLHFQPIQRVDGVLQIGSLLAWFTFDWVISSVDTRTTQRAGCHPALPSSWEGKTNLVRHFLR